VSHPNVCRVFDLVEHDGRPFLALELAARGTLRDTLAEPTARPLADGLADAHAVVAGVAAIHAAGTTHRDIKPSKVVRMADGRLAVSDFGIAARHDATTTLGPAGKPSYMAP
jgi:serine/threonine-protein kinase